MLQHQERKWHYSGENLSYSVGYVPTETDYVDPTQQHDYKVPDLPLKKIRSNVELQRLMAANEAFDLSLRGRTMPLRLLKRVFTEQQYNDYSQTLTEPAEQSEVEYGEGMPEQLKSYNAKVARADLAWGQFERLSNGPRRSRSAAEAERRAESLYEDALECLEEIFDCAKRGDWGREMVPRLQRWMDRPVDFEAGVERTVDTDVHGIPRVRGSRSKYAMDSGLPKLSKRLKREYCALTHLLVAACEIAFAVPAAEPAVLTPAHSMDLRQRLRKLSRSASSI